jgi:hypothetical protein
VTNSRIEGAIANDREKGKRWMTAFETRERTRLLAGEQPKGRVALVTGSTRAIGAAIGCSLASRLDQLGRSDELARVAHFLFAGACFLISGRVWALNITGEV